MKTFVFGRVGSEIFPKGEVGDIGPQCFAVLSGRYYISFIVTKTSTLELKITYSEV